MSWQHRPYRDRQDFRTMLEFLSTATTVRPAAGFIQPGDLTWWMYQNNELNPSSSIELFHSVDGQLLGFVFSDPSTWAVMQARPDVPADLLDQMLTFAEQRAGEDVASLIIWAFDGDTALTAALDGKSYARSDQRTVQFEYHPAAQGSPDVTDLPLRFSFMHIPDDLDLKTERVNLHRAVWHPSRVTLDAYNRLREAPTYCSDLDVVLVTPEGKFAAYVLGWFDPRTHIGILEPVGTHPDYRGQGLGRLVVREVTRRLAQMGAERVIIRTPESNQGAVKLYASSGFGITGSLHDYRWSPTDREP